MLRIPNDIIPIEAGMGKRGAGTWRGMGEGIRLIQAAFSKGHLMEECTCKTIVLIQKGNGEYQGIGIVEVLWKTVTGIPNFRLMAVIQFYETLHGLRMGRGTGTTNLESKLLQQMMDTREEFLYETF